MIGGVALTLLIVYFMLAEATTLELKFSMTPPNVSPTLQRLELFTRDMRSFVQATTILGLVNGVAAGIYLWLLGIDFPVLWGVFAFFMTFIPTLGIFIAVLPPAFLALINSGWKEALLVLIGYIVIYAVTGSMRSGRFVGRRLNLSPLAILLSIILWGWVLGLMGGLLAVPMTLLVRRLFVEAYDESRWMTDLLGRPGRGDTHQARRDEEVRSPVARARAGRGRVGRAWERLTLARPQGPPVACLSAASSASGGSPSTAMASAPAARASR